MLLWIEFFEAIACGKTKAFLRAQKPLIRPYSPCADDGGTKNSDYQPVHSGQSRSNQTIV